jgi:hypothetical protein
MPFIPRFKSLGFSGIFYKFVNKKDPGRLNPNPPSPLGEEGFVVSSAERTG